MIKRPDVPASDDVFSIFVFGNDRNISGIAGIAESHREHAFVPQISGNVQIMHRSQRRTLAAGHNIIGTEIVDDRNTGQVSQKPRIADLNRIGGFAAGNGWRKMIASLTMKTERGNIFPAVTGTLQKRIDGFRNQRRIFVDGLQGKAVFDKSFHPAALLPYAGTQAQHFFGQAARIRF